VLLFFRTLYVFWVEMRFPGIVRGEVIRQTLAAIEFLTRDADADLTRLREEDEDFLARYAALRMVLRRSAHTLMTIGTSYVGNAADAASYARDAARELSLELWGGISSDVSILDEDARYLNGRSSFVLAESAFLDFPESGFRKEWEALKYELRSLGTSWDVWIGWYELRAAGTPTVFGLRELDDSLVLQLANEDEAFWGRDVALVNRDLTDRIDEARRILEAETTIGQAIPEQQPAPVVTEEQDGRVVRARTRPDASLGLSVTSQVRLALIQSIDDFDSEFPVHNHRSLSTILRRLRAGLGETVAEMNIIGVGVAAIRLEEFAKVAKDECSSAMAAEVLALNTAVGHAMGQFDEWGRFKQAAPRDPAVENEAILAAGQVMAKLENSEIIATELTQHLADEASSIVTSVGVGGSALERSAYLRGVSNVLATFSKILLKALRNAGVDAYSGSRKATETIVKLTTVAAFLAAGAELVTLSGAAPQWFGWLKTLVEFLVTKAG
jgi:hypothetical protein